MNMERKFETDEKCNPLLEKPVKIDLTKVIVRHENKKKNVKGKKLVWC